MFDAVDARRAEQQGRQAGGAGGRTTYDALLSADDSWARLRGAAPATRAAAAALPTSSGSGPAPQFVRVAEPYEPLLRLGKAPPPQQQFDVVVCGGTLGVFLAAALAARGRRVAVVERGPLRGREQEWNLSRAELRALARAGAFESLTDAEEAVVSEFNPVRVGFYDSWSGGGKQEGATAAAAASSSPSSSSSSPSRDVWARDVLNLGVSPDALVQAARRALERRGGRVFERAGVDGATVHPDAVALRVRTAAGGGAAAAGASPASQLQDPSASSSSLLVLSARLVVDCMGHASPAARQLRHGRKPDGVCLVVGGCADGFDPQLNTTADVIATASDAGQLVGGVPTQLFWEAFPAGAGGGGGGEGGGGNASSSSSSSTRRTTYMFAYMDAAAWRPSLAAMFEAYWRLMPQYQRALLKGKGAPPSGGAEGGSNGNNNNADNINNADNDTDGLHLLSTLSFERLLFGVFPTYRDSPLKPGFDRVLQVGDASGLQSPLSFGGLAALSRHLPRLVSGLDDALACGQVTREGLGALAPYMPNLSAAWMLQRAMTATREKGGGGGGSSSGSNSNGSSGQTPLPPLTSAPPALINRMLGGNFQAMAKLGDRVSRPFLQDVLRPGGLLLTLTAQMAADPLFVPPLLLHLGPGPLADFTRHFAAMALYDALYRGLGPVVRFFAGEGSSGAAAGGVGGGAGGSSVVVAASAASAEGGGWLARHGQGLGVPPSVGYRLRRTLDAWKYGSGMDYDFD